jgi:hypothetical protein
MTINHVCSDCFDDDDLKRWIHQHSVCGICDACGKAEVRVSELSDLCSYIESCLSRYWGFAVEQLPFETAEGGYQGTTWTTEEILFEEAELSLPNDSDDRLRNALIFRLIDETWCDWDWLTLDEDQALKSSWDRFCRTVKHSRRFFFYLDKGDEDDRDSFTPSTLLRSIALLCENNGLVSSLPKNTVLWRARSDLKQRDTVCEQDFGPPPEEAALQSNRMSPPGIPIFYLASTAETALYETQIPQGWVGQWSAKRDLRILDLRQLPDIPGIFSDAERATRLGLVFLHQFVVEIMKSVDRDQRVHIDYLPSQVVSEFFRDYDFRQGRIEGIAYRSSVTADGWNVALFVDLIPRLPLGARKEILTNLRLTFNCYTWGRLGKFQKKE